jgi:hypothetical protein
MQTSKKNKQNKTKNPAAASVAAENVGTLAGCSDAPSACTLTLAPALSHCSRAFAAGVAGAARWTAAG